MVRFAMAAGSGLLHSLRVHLDLAFVQMDDVSVRFIRVRNGVGRALVASAEAWALGNGFSSIGVRSNVARVESHPFYERLGFARTKTQHVYSKTLAQPAHEDR